MIYVILGQTASGKTSLALKLAKKLSLPIISADAYQCYKMMQIGTDKPKADEVEGINYHFFDEYLPDYKMSVFEFQKQGRELIEKYLKVGKDIIVTGGTFLYIKALLFNYEFKEEKNDDNYEDLSLNEMQELLKKKNIDVYNSIDIFNPRRVIRALRLIDNDYEEALKSTYKNNNIPIYPCLFFNIETDIITGNELIDKRVDLMFENHFTDEVKKLINDYDYNLPAFKAIGYPEVISYLKKEITLDECKNLIKIHTHQLAKKQRTFIRHQFDNVICKSKDEIYTLIENDFYRKERTRILLKNKMPKFENMRVLLVGLGGVGGITLLSLVRLGIYNLTIIDGDKIAVSNLNRQFLFDYYDIGSNKAEIAKNKVLKINPLLNITSKSVFIKDRFELKDEKFDYIIDCIDDIKGKAELFLKAKEDNCKLIVSMGFGFHLDSTKIKIGKLKETNGHMVKAYRDELKNRGIDEDDIDNINIVFPLDARMKAEKNSKTIGSLVTAPNGGGLAVVSSFIKMILSED